MDVQALTDQVTSLVSKDIVQPKTAGVTRPDIETAAIVESLAIAMMLEPRSALYVHYLAKNALVVAIDAEVTAILALIQTIQDLSNTTFAIQDTKALSRAQAAMLQLGEQGQLSSSSNAFDRYSAAVDDFLEKQLAKNVRVPGATSLSRPGDEASASLPTDLALVKSLHVDLLDRLYSLSVGVQNFLSTPFSSMVGANALYRAKKDLDSILSTVTSDNSGVQSRDLATRLIASRATIRLFGAPLSIDSPVIDTSTHQPPDQLLTGMSPPVAVTATTTPGPFVLASSLTVSVKAGESYGGSVMNQAGNAAAVLSDPVTYPVTLPVGSYLFFHLEAPTQLAPDWVASGSGFTKTIKVPVAGTMSLGDVVNAIGMNSGGEIHATDFIFAGNRLLVWASDMAVQTLSIVTMLMDPSTSILYANSAHVALGFVSDISGTTGSTPTKRLLAICQALMASVASVASDSNGAITFTSLNTSPGTQMQFSGNCKGPLGLGDSYVASSSFIIIQGAGGVVSPLGLVDVGDFLECPTGKARIVAVSADGVTLDSPLPTFSGPITVTSGLLKVWEEIDYQVNLFLGSWMVGPYAAGLASLDQVIAVLIGSPTSPRRGEAVDLLNDLQTQLLALRASITSDSTTLGPGSGSDEALVVDNIIALFVERNFDRALDFFLRCKIQEMFEFDWQTASYGGNLMKAVEDVAQADVAFPDVTKDEGEKVLGVRKA